MKNNYIVVSKGLHFKLKGYYIRKVIQKFIVLILNFQSIQIMKEFLLY